MIGYEQEESVSIALDMLNEREIKPGYMIFIDRAKFDADPAQYLKQLNEKKKIDKIQLLKLKQDQKKHHGWQEDDQIEGLKIVIITNLFSKEDVEREQDNEEFWKALEQDLLSECTKIGPVAKIQLFNKNPLGPAKVKYNDTTAAEKCIEVMNGRFFDKRKLECVYWDGETDFNRVKETQEEEEQRIKSFEQFLHQSK